MFSGTRKRIEIVVDRKAPSGTRVFAALELFCFYASWASFVALAVYVGGRRFGLTLSEGASGTLRVALAAAVGFLTNWLAIEMLFKPYERISWLLPWPQGLVPRNKAKIAEKAAEKITTQLLNPDEIAERVVVAVASYLRQDDAKKGIADRSAELIRKYRDEITAVISPVVEAKIVEFVRRNATPEKLNEFWDQQVAERLNDPEIQAFLAKQIAAGVRSAAPQLTDELKIMLADYIRRYIEEKTFFTLFADTISNGVVALIDWSSVQETICRRLDEPKTEELVKQSVLQMAERFREWLKSEESLERVDAFLDEARKKFENYLRGYLTKDLPKTIQDFLFSDIVRNWIDEQFLPNAQTHIEAFVREKTPVFLEEINMRQIVVDSINGQNMKDFHQMVGDVTAEHLGAIQVLGYFLGALVGLSQLLARF